MKSNLTLLRHLTARVTGALLLCAFLLTAAACGGGTTGTGGTGSQIDGRLLDISGAPVADATLTVEETGDGGITDGSGAFHIDTEIQNGSFTLLVEAGETQAKTVVNDIPPGDQTVDVALQLNPQKKTVTVTGKHVKPRPTATPIPVPTAVLPTPTPTGAPTVTPTAIVTPALTVTDTPTPMPTTVIIPPTPTPIPKTEFLGIVHADPALLVDAEVGIAGRAKRALNPDGTFKFFIPASDDNTVVVVKTDFDTARAQLTGVTGQASKVTLNLSLDVRPNGNLRLTINSIEIIESADGSDSQGSTVSAP